MNNIVIGIDLGGTNLRIGAVTSKNHAILPRIMKSAVIAEADEPLKTLCDIIESYIQTSGIQSVKAISMGVPSSVANDHETVICTTNIMNKGGTPVFFRTNVADYIRNYFHIPVIINNDVNNIMLYDVMKHQLQKKTCVVGIYIGTGVGASVMINGEFLQGENGVQLDIGHMPFFRGGETCVCGKKGCCECYASGWRLQQIREAYYPETPIYDLFTKHRKDLRLKAFVQDCAYVFSVMATIFNPSVMIVGGGVVEMTDFPKEEFEMLANRYTGRDVMGFGLDYVYSEDDVTKGIVGAALYARKKLLEI